MKLGIIVAMEKELALLEAMRDSNGMIGGKQVSLVQGGIGKVNAAVATCDLISSFKPDAIISTGVAGGVAPERADVLDIVIGEEVAYHDVDCGPGIAPGQVQGMPQFFAADEMLARVATECAMASGRAVKATIATGDQFVQSAETVRRIRELYPKVAAIDMESAAIAQVCHIRAVPFLAVRVVSDIPGVENQFARYCDFWDRIRGQSFDFVKEILRKLP